MLKLVKAKDPSSKLVFFNQFDPKTACFIVSDIKNKQFLSAELFKKHSFLPGSCVLRANEFYREIFPALNISWSLRPDSFVHQLLAEFLKSEKKLRHLIRSQRFFEGFKLCLPLFLEESSAPIFQEWFDCQKDPLFPKNWLPLFEKFFKQLQSKNILPESAVKPLVWRHISDKNPDFLKKEIFIVDLAFSMDLCEKDIFKELSQFKDVYILSPDLNPFILYEDSPRPFYSQWEKELKKEDIVSLKPSSSNSALFFQTESPTQWREVKQAVAQASQWLDEGVSPDEIAVYAPNIEDYWPALKEYLTKESIPFKKTISASLIDFPGVKYLLSALRLHLGRFSFEDLESFCFYKANRKDFSNFKENYFIAPGRQSARRHLFQDKIREPKNKPTGFEFIEWLLSFLPVDFSESSLKSLLRMLGSMAVKERLPFQSWLSLFEAELFSQGLEIEKEQSFGLSCLSFNAFHSVKSSYVFLLGLNELAFKESSLLKEDSVQSLLDDLGFSLAFQFPKEREKSLLWFLQSSRFKEVYLSSFLYDFNGQIQNQSLIYLLLNKMYSAKSKKITKSLSYENLQKKEKVTDILKEKSPQQARAVEVALKENPNFFCSGKVSLSPSRLKTYSDCPFKYAGAKLFYVEEKKSVDYELSALARGLSAHKLFQLVLERYPDLNLDKKQIEDLIEKSLPGQENFIYEKQIILSKEYFIQLLEEFLEKEKQDRKDYPLIQPVAFEAELKAFWNQKQGQLSSQGDYLFRGKIDRIDRYKEGYMIRDYKASGSSLTHVEKWVTKDEFQLLFYAQALKNGLVLDLPAGAVSALFYSIYNEDFTAKGFVEEGGGLQNFMGKRKGRHRKTENYLEEQIDQANKKTQEIAQKMEAGSFAPNPKNRKLCETCFYKKWCRVEHV